MDQLRARFGTERPSIATRQASQLVIDAIAEALPNLLGGSADLNPLQPDRARTSSRCAMIALQAATSTMASASTPWRRR